MLFENGGNGQTRWRTAFAINLYIEQFEAAIGECAGLVEHEGIGACQGFQGMAARGDQPAAHEPAGGGRDRRGCRERQGARTGHDQHGNGDRQPARRVVEIPEQRDTGGQ